jgi:hypothetical protein
MLAQLRVDRVLVSVVRIPVFACVFACALALLVGTVTVSGAGVPIGEGLRAWAAFRTRGYTGASTSRHQLRDTGLIVPGAPARQGTYGASSYRSSRTRAGAGALRRRA